MKVLCLVALFVALSYTQIIGGQEPKILLDDFGLGNGEAIVDYDGTVFDNDIQQGVLVLLTDNIDVPETDLNAHIVGVNSYTPTDASTQFVFDTNALTGCNSLIGCVRDMEIRVWNGLSGRTFSSNIFDSTADFLQQYTGADFQGEWTVASPKSSNSLYTLQYDANKGMALTTSGLGGVDITAGGDSRSFAFFVIIDLESIFSIEIYRQSSGGLCSADTTVQPILAGQGEYTLQQTLIVVDFGQFTGDCDFTDVGAIQLKLPSDDAVDAIIRRFSVFGVPSSPSPSRSPIPSQSRTPAPTQSRTPAPTQSRTPAPTQSNTRTPAPSQSNTPAPSQTRTPTPSRSVECSVICECPVFTCHLIFDDDEADVIYNQFVRVRDSEGNIVARPEDDDQ